MKSQVLTPRTEELLVESALRPLSDAETVELGALGAADDDSLDLAAAALAVATLTTEAMPADLLERLAALPLATAPTAPTAPADTAPTAPADIVPIAVARAKAADRKRGFSAAWLAAAAGVAVAIGAGVYARNASTTVSATAEPAPSVARAELLAAGGDARTLTWSATTDAAATGASGDVVWSAARQRGYMRFVGLAANDPKAWQYQLWIFDRTRDQAYPIDGGVFDVSSTGEVVVAISAKLHVDDATLFAVTVERPGGVVVSKRERIVVTAKPS